MFQDFGDNRSIKIGVTGRRRNKRGKLWFYQIFIGIDVVADLLPKNRWVRLRSYCLL